jgi:hypothetical protein
MQGINVANLLSVWESGRAVRTGERAWLLLQAAEPDREPLLQRAMTVGRRDAALLRLRQRQFDERITCLANCKDCGEQLEMNFAVTDILLPDEEEILGSLFMTVGAYQVSFRLPTTWDMVELDRASGSQALDRWLLQRCLLLAQKDEVPCGAADLPQDVVDAIAARMSESDPQAEIELALTCPSCGVQSQVLFDIVSFLWREIEAWAVQLLNEVHIIASAYGWSEREILALPQWRRGFYLDRIGA